MFSQFMFNRLILNPGYAGSTNTFNVSLAYRRQFVGLEGGPQIQAITIDAPLKTKHMGFGIRAIQESIGATNQNEVSVIYAYHLNLSKGVVSLGVEGGIFNQSIDFTNLRKTTQDDNAVPIGKESMLVPDAALGLYYSSEKLYIGGSFRHLLQNELNFSGYTGSDRTVIAKLSSHSYVLGGYTFKPQENIRIEPSFLLKYVASAPVQIDMNVNTTFKNAFTIGATYRSQNAIVFLFQYSIKGRLRFGYAYDYIISELSSYGYSTHGIMLSYHIPSKEKTPELEKEKEEEIVPEILSVGDSLSQDVVDIPVSPPTKDTAEVIEPTLAEIPSLHDKEDPSESPVVTDKKDSSEVVNNTPTEEKPTSQEEQQEDVVIVEPANKVAIVFRIQILTRKEPLFLTPVNFKGLENVGEYQENGVFKYVIGRADNYDYAKNVLLNLAKMGGYLIFQVASGKAVYGT